MTQSTQFLIDHGAPIVFASVLVEQLGLPLPVVPLLLAAGALSATGQFSFVLALGLTVMACLIADLFWFYLGRHRGHRVLGLLCRISLEPDSCVRRTQNVFTRYGLKGVVVGKFVPGLGTVAPPLAGMAGVGVGRFLIADVVGSVLYGGGFLGLGYVFSDQLQHLAAALSRVGVGVLGLVIGLGAVYIGFKYWERQGILRKLRMARITTAELRERQDAGEDLVILDLRPVAELDLDLTLIPGAVHLAMEEVERRHHEIPRDREVIVYCSCPNEVSSARVALQLHRKGITRVRPLLGGIDAWRDSHYPLERATRPPMGLRTVAPLSQTEAHIPPSAVADDDSARRAA